LIHPILHSDEDLEDQVLRIRVSIIWCISPRLVWSIDTNHCSTWLLRTLPKLCTSSMGTVWNGCSTSNMTRSTSFSGRVWFRRARWKSPVGYRALSGTGSSSRWFCSHSFSSL